MRTEKIRGFQSRFGTDHAIDDALLSLVDAAGAEYPQRFHVVDSHQAAAALGAELEELCRSTQPEASMAQRHKEVTAELGAALLALSDLLA